MGKRAIKANSLDLHLLRLLAQSVHIKAERESLLICAPQSTEGSSQMWTTNLQSQGSLRVLIILMRIQ